MSKKSKNLNFEKKILVFKNVDKNKHEKWSKNRDWLNFPCPSRIVVSANPNSGKTNLIKNILIRAKPHFKKIILLHYDDESSEYDDIPGAVRISEIPNPKDSKLFNGVDKTCLIIDDYEFKFLSKEKQRYLDRLLGFTSTHRFCTVIISCQDFFNLPPIVRRSSNVFFIWRGTADLDSLYYIGRRLGYNKQEFKGLFKNCTDRYDNLCFDLSLDTPAPIRKNSYEKIEKPKEEKK